MCSCTTQMHIQIYVLPHACMYACIEVVSIGFKAAQNKAAEKQWRVAFVFVFGFPLRFIRDGGETDAALTIQTLLLLPT